MIKLAGIEGLSASEIIIKGFCGTVLLPITYLILAADLVLVCVVAAQDDLPASWWLLIPAHYTLYCAWWGVFHYHEKHINQVPFLVWFGGFTGALSYIWLCVVSSPDDPIFGWEILLAATAGVMGGFILLIYLVYLDYRKENPHEST